MAKYIPSSDKAIYNNGYKVNQAAFHFQNKPSLSFTESSDDIQALIMANAIYNKFNMDWTHKFSRFGIIDPYNALVSTKEYVFITKPDLCLFDTATKKVCGSLATNPFFIDALNRYKDMGAQLQSSLEPTSSPFMNILSNTLTSTVDLPDISAETIDTASNVFGTKISYRGTSHKSDEDFDFNLEFEDTKFLDVYMLFKMYDEYEKLKWNGAIDFSANACGSDRWQNYIVNKVLHDQVAIYKFIVSDDGSRIIYWARYTGCYPISVPRSAFSDTTSNDPQKITVGWKCQFVRDMDPIIINHFNLLVKGISGFNSKSELPLYNNETHAMDGRWAACPYIDIQQVNDTRHGLHREYYLKWKI